MYKTIILLALLASSALASTPIELIKTEPPMDIIDISENNVDNTTVVGEFKGELGVPESSKDLLNIIDATSYTSSAIKYSLPSIEVTTDDYSVIRHVKLNGDTLEIIKTWPNKSGVEDAVKTSYELQFPGNWVLVKTTIGMYRVGGEKMVTVEPEYIWE